MLTARVPAVVMLHKVIAMLLPFVTVRDEVMKMALLPADAIVQFRKANVLILDIDVVAVPVTYSGMQAIEALATTSDELLKMKDELLRRARFTSMTILAVVGLLESSDGSFGAAVL